MAEKETKMKLMVDLQCDKCFKKVKKILCKFPQIRDPVYDQKNNIVTIIVVCCNPEKIRDELYCKGWGVIKCIEIVKPTPPRSPPPTPPPKSPVCRRRSCPPTSPPDCPRRPCPSPPVCSCRPCPPTSPPVCPCPPPQPPVLIGVCCVLCSKGRPGGPCCHGHDGPCPCNDGCYERPVCGGGRPCHLSHCREYLCEENASGCTSM